MREGGKRRDVREREGRGEGRGEGEGEEGKVREGEVSGEG